MKIIDIQIDKRGFFIERVNKYVAKVRFENGEEELCHVHDPGRLKELLFEGNTLYLKNEDKPTRKTKWDVIYAKKGDEKILIHSGYHRKISEAFIKNGTISYFKDLSYVKPEIKYKNSRLDFLLKRENENIWVEVKGCSLEVNNVALFPDAPTKRGKKHLEELIELKENGDRSALLILVLTNSNLFKTKEDTDPEFSKTFRDAVKKGVEIIPAKFSCKDDGIYFEEVIKYEA